MPGSLTLSDARAIIDAALAESERRGVTTAVAVVDARGDLIMVARMDGARSYYADVAYGKAMGSALWEQPSRAFGPQGGSSSVRQRVNTLQGGRIVFATGAVPLRQGGTVVGAVGVGGSGPESDEEIAMHAAAAGMPELN